MSYYSTILIHITIVVSTVRRRGDTRQIPLYEETKLAQREVERRTRGKAPKEEPGSI